MVKQEKWGKDQGEARNKHLRGEMNPTGMLDVTSGNWDEAEK